MAQNSLAKETSPYLLQHAGNPVDWHAWNDQSLQKARDENKPIFLSIGYSSCHWCHVMAHQSFENPDIARIMNDNFVNIKVDREERPDIDDIYQKACQLTTGQGGWPLSIFLTPDQEPFYVGTYFPALNYNGRPGFGSICKMLAQAWQENPADVKNKARDFVDKLQKTEEINTPSRLDPGMLEAAAANLYAQRDPTHGGFGMAPKFPSTANISFLLLYSKMSGAVQYGEFALKTLKKMANGGIFDQIAGGFHRYSTDSRWFLPHFEKMLYDNAQIPLVYAKAYQMTKDDFYLDVLKKTLDFVLAEMTGPDGGFYCAYDADSDGAEGRYYVWTKQQIRDVLGDDADLFCTYYDVTDGGNWEGANILCRNIGASSVASQFGMPVGKMLDVISGCCIKLAGVRSKRTKPGLDDKILVSWNAMMITALAKGHQVTQEQRYLDAAKKCLDFILGTLYDGKLYHTSNKNARIDGYLEDYAFLLNSLLDVFEASPEARYLDTASELAGQLIRNFWDSKQDSFFMTGTDQERLIIRTKNNYDLAVPSGNSAAAMALLRLYHLTLQEEFLNVAIKAMRKQAGLAAANPSAFGYMLEVIGIYLSKPIEITILNAQNRDLCRMIDMRYIPNSIRVKISGRGQLDGLKKYPFFAGKEFDQETAVYVCRDSVCSLPLRTIKQVEENL